MVSLLLFENKREEKARKFTRFCFFLLASPALLAWVFDQRKCEKEHNLDVWKAPTSQFKRLNYCPFSASLSVQHNRHHEMENLLRRIFWFRNVYYVALWVCGDCPNAGRAVGTRQERKLRFRVLWGLSSSRTGFSLALPKETKASVFHRYWRAIAMSLSGWVVVSLSGNSHIEIK